MKTTIELVADFHVLFERPIRNVPNLYDTESNLLRLRLLREEMSELEHALAERNEEEALDALTDIQYILDGTYLTLGFHKLKDEAFRVVHEANMLKFDGKVNIREDGKILKPKGWKRPNLKPLLDR